MNPDELQAIVAKAVSEQVGKLQVELAAVVADATQYEFEADHVVVVKGIEAAARRAGCRPGAEQQLVAGARADGWKHVGHQLVRLNAEGTVIGQERNLDAWVGEQRGSRPFCFESDHISADDRQAFRDNLEAVANGTMRVGPAT
ncbi:MAG: hypothetical protein O3A51_07465 [Verrucomicrobia bacterium]|nr:hypothetical protein [Verrucomicrobiota bacterium]